MRRLYDTREWRKMRARQLAEHPLCAMCERMGRITAATIADHIIPHNNNHKLFFDNNNLQSLCSTCHSGIKRMADIHGYSQACGVDGIPVDLNHPWLKGRRHEH
jgi:5-methylcytosine-specific restriction enzyme A